MWNRLNVFVRNKYTSSSSIRIVALRSVKKNDPESYDFAATFKTFQIMGSLFRVFILLVFTSLISFHQIQSV
jgi:hypothetical protein